MESSKILSASKERIRSAYSALLGRPLTEDEENSIRRAFILVSGDEEWLEVLESYTPGDGNDDDRHGNRDTQGAANAIQTEQICGLQEIVHKLRREIREMKVEQEGERNATRAMLQKMMAALNRLSRVPPRNVP